jgi:hypothetical protein
MPPEHDEERDRQLEALRRYVSGLTIQRERGAPGQAAPAPVQRRRPAWPWMLLTLLLMAVSLAGGIAIGAGRTGEQGTGQFAGVTASSAAAVRTATPECVEAVEAANRSIGHALKVETALREHTQIMNDLLDGRIDGATALRTGTPSLIIGSGESANFDLALADYKQVVDQCQLRTP